MQWSSFCFLSLPVCKNLTLILRTLSSMYTQHLIHPRCIRWPLEPSPQDTPLPTQAPHPELDHSCYPAWGHHLGPLSSRTPCRWLLWADLFLFFSGVFIISPMVAPPSTPCLDHLIGLGLNGAGKGREGKNHIKLWFVSQPFPTLKDFFQWVWINSNLGWYQPHI
jgi:hypothetical protein